MGTVKDRNGMDLTEAEDIKKRWQEYTEELYKKDLHNPDYHDRVIAHLEPDILECKVKWALEASPWAKLVQVMEFQLNASLNMPANVENSAVATGLEKVSFHSNPKERQSQRMLKLRTTALISHTIRVMLKILQTRLQQYTNRELPDVQPGFTKGRGTRDQTANICWIIKKAREFQKNIYFWFIDYAKDFDCVNHNKLWKILKEMGIPDHLTCLLRNLYAGQEAS